jgi:undecaprenyl-diphosphatase
MSIWEAIVLGIVQGLTEFLPISSTAHLKIVPVLFGWGDPGAAFSAVIQIGTLVAVVAYFWKDIVEIVKATLGGMIRKTPDDSTDARLGWMIVAGSVPIVVCGLLFKKHIETTLRSLYVISASLVIVALALELAEFLLRRRQQLGVAQKEMRELTWVDAITIGCAQAVALIPGMSRSGTTIAAGLFRNLSRSTAARFSFLLSLPAVFGAAVKELYDERDKLLANSHETLNLVVATVVAGIVGYAAIAFLLNYLRTRTMRVFVIYRIALACLLVGLLWAGWIADTAAGTHP